jgi:ribosomal protein L30E
LQKAFDIVAKSLTFVSTTTRNKSIQSKLEILFAKGKLEFCFDNTTRNMKSIKSKLEIVAKKFKLQFLFQQRN